MRIKDHSPSPRRAYSPRPRPSPSPRPRSVQSAKDYYWVLGIPRNATDSDILKAYRKLAARWHPSKNKENRAEAEQHFRDVSEAYQVLANRTLRQLYDRFGHEGLVPEDAGINFDGMIKHPTVFPFREAMDVYMEFFGNTDPHDLPTGQPVFDEHGFENSFTGFPRPASEVKDLPKSQSGLTLYKGYIFSGPTGDEDIFRSVCVTTKVIDGRNIVTNRNVSRGVETVTVRENGVLKSKTIDGKQQPIN